MKPNPLRPAFLLATILALPLQTLAAEKAPADPIDVARQVIKANREVTVAEEMQFTPAEAEKFWPLYLEYRKEMNRVGDTIQRVVAEYSNLYPNVPEDRAKKMLGQMTDADEDLAAIRGKHLKRIARVLPAAKTLRFAQVEARLDLAVRLEMAAGIPMVPIKGNITGRRSAAAVTIGGVAGGGMIQTFELNAVVCAIEKETRRVTLISDDGIMETITVGPEAINFKEVEIGDRLIIVATEEIIVQTASAEAVGKDGAAGLVGLAPEGSKPGAVIGGTAQVSATVTAIDSATRMATVEFEDGTTKTLPVRKDVDLSKHKVGEKLVFLVTEMVAVSVQKP